MFTQRVVLFLLLGSFVLVPMQAAPAAPTVKLLVPIYDYPRSMGTIARASPTNGKIAGPL